MSSFRTLAATLALASIVSAATLAACSSSSPSNPPAASGDAGETDAPLGPLFCSLPVPVTCPMTAPCDFAGWGCPALACDGYFTVTDGEWVYYYSAIGGALAGEVAVADAGFVSCPYDFVPPTSCAPTIASECAAEGGAGDAGGTLDGAAAVDGTNDAGDGDNGADGASATDASAD